MLVAGALGAALGACAPAPRRAPSASGAPPGVGAAAWRDRSPHRSGFVVAARDSGGRPVRLHYLDWGGGPPPGGPAAADAARPAPVVFLAGLGHTAHVWDEFAPRFTDRHRVLALTRRGFGDSDYPEGGYDRATLAADVLAFLDQVGVGRAHLVGHSIAGEEMTRFAGAHPERVASLVYLDAAYDRAGAARALGRPPYTEPPAPPWTARDSASPAAVRARLAFQFGGVPLPESEVRAMLAFGPDGRFVRQRAGAAAAREMWPRVEPPDYARVRAPALAIYKATRPALEERPWLAGDTALLAAIARWQRERVAPQLRRQVAEFRTIPGSRAVTLRSTHYVFVTSADTVERLMRDFLREAERRP